MKKILFVAMALLFAMGAQAQIVTSHSKAKYKVKKDWGFEWIVRTGVNVNSITGPSNEVFNLSSKIGYNASFAMNLPLMKSGLYFGAEVGAVSAGFNDDSPELSHGLEFAPSIGWKIKLSNSVKLDVHVGAFYDYYYDCGWADFSETWTEERYDGWLDMIVTEEYTSSYNYDTSGQDLGIKAGIGLWYKKFNLDFTFHRGFRTACELWFRNEGSQHDYYNQNFMIRLGYSF